MDFRRAGIMMVSSAMGCHCLFAQTPSFQRELSLADPRMNGPDVKAVQARLLSLEYAEVSGADGWFGPKTEQAVRRFEFRMGLDVDGVIEEETWQALFAEEARDGTRLSGAPPAVIGHGGYLLGGWSAEEKIWIPGEGVLSWYDDGQPISVRSFSRDTFAAKGSASLAAVRWDVPFVSSPRLSIEDVYGISLSDFVFSLSATHNPFPRGPVTVTTNSPSRAVSKAVTGYLKSKGITVTPDDMIVYAIDVDGDHDTDYFIERERYGSDNWEVAPPQSYSCVLYIETLSKNQTKLIELMGEYYPEGTDLCYNRFVVEAIADLNGDGRYEVLVNASYYEGSFNHVFEIWNGKAEMVLTAGTGV